MDQLKIIAFGESTFKGYLSGIGDSPTYEIPKQLSDNANVNGVSCTYTNSAHDGLELQQSASGHTAFVQTPDHVVLINSGLNDAINSANSGVSTGFIDTLKSLVDEARYAGKLSVIQASNRINLTGLTSASTLVDSYRTYIKGSLSSAKGLRVEPNDSVTAPNAGDVHPDASGYVTMYGSLNTDSFLSAASLKLIGIWEVVQRIYVAGFGRGAESGGRDYWTAAIANNTLNDVGVASAIIAANPAFTSATNTQFVSAVYDHIYNDTTVDGQSYWVSALDGGTSRGEVMQSIINATVTYSGSDSSALSRQRRFNNKVKAGAAAALSEKGNTVTAEIGNVSAVTDAWSTVAAYCSYYSLFASLP